MTRLVARLAIIAAGALLASFATTSPASAHGEGETTEGYLLIQQALGHLAHDTTMTGIDLAMEKIDDALETEDQEGVNLEKLQQGKAALEGGDIDRARTLLQDSIQQAMANLPPATGNQTGTQKVTPELEGRSDLRTQDWVLLAGSALVLVLGVWLAFHFRPHDSVRTLRARRATAVASGSGEGGKEV